MTETRKLLLGPFQLGGLGMLEKIVNAPVFLEHLPPTSFVSLFYSSLIQAGVEKIEVVGPHYNHGLPRGFPEHRISVNDGAEFERAVSVVEHVFQQYLVAKHENVQSFQVTFIKNLLIDLLHAASRNTNVAWLNIDSPPVMQTIKSEFLPELYFPIKTLLDSMQSEQANVAIPAVVVSAENVARFNQVVSSNLFRSYESDHEGLGENTTAITTAIGSIDRSSRLLSLRNPLLIKQKRLVITVLPITTKVIDTVFGRLPGLLAEFSTNLLLKWFQQDRRIVIYRFDDVLGPAFEDRVDRLIQKKVQQKTLTEDHPHNS